MDTEAVESRHVDARSRAVSSTDWNDGKYTTPSRTFGQAPEPLQYRRPCERPFMRAERDHVTILFGGLTQRQDRLVEAALEGLGYKAQRVPLPTKLDFQTGREYGNTGQCNPTYFTVGTLLNFLMQLRDVQGVPTERIISDYVFVTANSPCGPCRFGMYESEYRLALRNAGFDGFRVLVFDQESDLLQSDSDAGLEMNATGFTRVLSAIFLGDVLNAVANHIRPYELVPGRTDEVLERCLALCQDALRARDGDPRPTLAAWLLARLTKIDVREIAAVLAQLRTRRYVEALARCRALIDQEIEIDYTRAKPIVKVTGEFWAQTTEGDGNFHMFRFLEQEGAETLTEPFATWFDYTIYWWQQYFEDRRRLSGAAEPPQWWNVARRLRAAVAYGSRDLSLRLAAWMYRHEYERMRLALGGTSHELAGQLALRRMGHPYYNSRTSGGEAHLEVAKNIYYHHRALAHMVLSLKPFGCMPSTQSDGAQAAVLARYPDMIFLPIETSGEGDTHAYSRTQMALSDAKVKCRHEFQAALARTGYTLADVRDFVATQRALRRPLQPLPHANGVIGRAANFVLHVGAQMDRDPNWRAHRQQVDLGSGHV